MIQSNEELQKIADKLREIGIPDASIQDVKNLSDWIRSKYYASKKD